MLNSSAYRVKLLSSPCGRSQFWSQGKEFWETEDVAIEPVFSQAVCDCDFVPNWCDKAEMDRERVGKGSGGRGGWHFFGGGQRVKPMGILQEGLLAEKMVILQTVTHSKGIQQPFACVCEFLCLCVANDVTLLVPWLLWADRQKLWMSSVFISTGRLMDCCSGGGVAF